MKYTGWDVEKYPKEFFEKYNILVGADDQIDKALRLGADGSIGVTFNFAGKWAHEVYQGVVTGDKERAERN